MHLFELEQTVILFPQIFQIFMYESTLHVVLPLYVCFIFCLFHRGVHYVFSILLYFLNYFFVKGLCFQLLMNQ